MIGSRAGPGGGFQQPQLSDVSKRQIGPIGTTARDVIGALLFVFGALGGKFIVIHGDVHLGLYVAALILRLLGFPAVLVAW